MVQIIFFILGTLSGANPPKAHDEHRPTFLENISAETVLKPGLETDIGQGSLEGYTLLSNIAVHCKDQSCTRLGSRRANSNFGDASTAESACNSDENCKYILYWGGSWLLRTGDDELKVDDRSNVFTFVKASFLTEMLVSK